MSMIDKMTIMGIRSFGVRDEDKQLIEFQHPLTLIVGQNGAGKTTIIECLKYITTGDQPANTKGGAFIHDPKLVGESEVRAQVGLKFSDLQRRECTIKRSLQVTQKAGKVTLKSLDGIITKDKADERVSISSKCADINAEMVTSLGVSKAVLENVIFCHQEDSNWPLSEGKVVKQKFDDIFAATRYIKSLELIKVARKEKMAVNKNDETHLSYLEGHRKTAGEKREILRENESKLNIARESAKQVEEKLKPLEKRLQEIAKSREDIMAVDRQLGESSSRLNQMKEDRKRLMERIQNLFHGTNAQLIKLQQGQEQLLETKRFKQEECENQVAPIQRKVAKLTEQKSALTLQQGKLQQEAESIETRKNERGQLLLKCSDEHEVCQGVIGLGLDISEETANRFESEMKRKIEKENEAMNLKQKKLDADVSDCDKYIQEVWQAKTELEEGAKHKQQAVRDKQRKVEGMSKEILHLEAASDIDRLNKLQRQLEQSENELRSAEQSCNTRELKIEVKSLAQQKAEQERQLANVDKDIVSMQKHAQSRTTIEVLKKDRSTKEDLIRRIKCRNVDTLSSINLLQGNKSIEEQVFPTKRTLGLWISKKEDEAKEVLKNLDKKRQDLTKLSTRHDMLTRELTQKTARYKQIDDEMFELCGSENFEDDLKLVETEIKDLQGSKGLTDGIQFMYKEFLKKLQSTGDHHNTPCPLCHRLFDQPQEVEELAQEVERKLELAPRKMLTQEQDLGKKQLRYKMLLQQRPAKEEMDKLQGSVIPDLKKQISELKEKITAVRHVVSEREECLRKIQEDEATAKSCANDVAQVDTTSNDVKDLYRRIAVLEAQLPSSGASEQTFDGLNAQKQTLAKAIQNRNKDIEEKREEIERQTNTLLKLRESVNSLQSEKLKLTSDVQKCEQLKELRKTTLEETTQLKRQINQSQDDIRPLQSKFLDLEGKKALAVQKRNNDVKILAEAIQILKVKLQAIVHLNNEIRRYMKSGKDRSLAKTQTAIQKADSDLASHEHELQSLRNEIASIQKDLATCKERQRDLDDNMALRKQDEAIEAVEENIVKMREKLGGMDSRQLERESNELSKQWHSLSKEKERCATREEGISEVVASLKTELEKEDLKHADERYKNCLIKFTTTKLAIDDLQKYHNALDRAIMRYHHLKMQEINKIIRDIWQETYRGHDIDYIEICSDEDTSTSSSSRRVYNYRLVKCCQGEKIDMRGRCSAGQKVLASLVIRLALAETFCRNCGILALDEPTSNLDRDHIESLAHALISITERRDAQRNFQLIIITHDEDFVELLGRSRYADHFFRVAKVGGKSRITRCPIQTINE